MTDIDIVADAKRDIVQSVRDRLEAARIDRLSRRLAPQPRYDDEFYKFGWWLDENG
jgi:hypothetical protein